MRKPFTLLSLFATLMLFVSMAVSARAELNLDFKLVNKTGYDIKEVYVGPTTSEEWGDNILDAVLKDGMSANITFNPKATAKKWDIKVVYTDGDTAAWQGYKLTDISKMTIHWDEKKQKSTAEVE